jgi:hypothetical protein
LNDFDFSSDDSSSLEEDEQVKHKQGDFTGLCLMGKSLRNIFDSDFDVSDYLSPEGASLRITKLENALCNQDKLLCKVFRENKKLNLEFESTFFEIASLRFMHDGMSAKPCDNNNMIMVNYADLWILDSRVPSQLDGVKLELKELKAHSLLLGACTSCPILRSNLEACAVEIKDLKHQIDHSSRYSVLSPLCDACGLLMFLMQLHKRTELSIWHFTRSILQVSYLYFPNGGRISTMSKTNTESNSNEYYLAI